MRDSSETWKFNELQNILKIRMLLVAKSLVENVGCLRYLPIWKSDCYFFPILADAVVENGQGIVSWKRASFNHSAFEQASGAFRAERVPAKLSFRLKRSKKLRQITYNIFWSIIRFLKIIFRIQVIFQHYRNIVSFFVTRKFVKFRIS